jgi:hypothetical protein
LTLSLPNFRRTIQFLALPLRVLYRLSSLLG